MLRLSVSGRARLPLEDRNDPIPTSVMFGLR